MGIQCYQIDIPRKCKGLGGYSFTVGYSSDGTCNFPTLGSNGIDGTCQDFEVILYQRKSLKNFSLKWEHKRACSTPLTPGFREMRGFGPNQTRELKSSPEFPFGI